MDFTLRERYTAAAERACRELLGNRELPQKALTDSMSYSLFSGGKRIRPFLTFEFYRACTGSDDIKPAEYYAAAIEMIHTFSLIHDDLPAMDDDELRRGRPTNHVIYGEATAVLAGDALIAEAFGAIARNSFCSDAQNIRAVRLLSEKTGAFGMTGGQQIDIQSEGKRLDRDELKNLCLLKTGCLISCAAMLGCIAGGADESLMKAAERFGNLIGLAFQIKDDLLDIEGNESELGKAVQKDSVIKKATFPSLYGEEQAKLALRSNTDEAIAALSVFPYKPSIKILAAFAKELEERTK